MTARLFANISSEGLRSPEQLHVVRAETGLGRRNHSSGPRNPRRGAACGPSSEDFRTATNLEVFICCVSSMSQEKCLGILQKLLTSDLMIGARMVLVLAAVAPATSAADDGGAFVAVTFAELRGAVVAGERWIDVQSARIEFTDEASSCLQHGRKDVHETGDMTRRDGETASWRRGRWCGFCASCSCCRWWAARGSQREKPTLLLSYLLSTLPFSVTDSDCRAPDEIIIAEGSRVEIFSSRAPSSSSSSSSASSSSAAGNDDGAMSGGGGGCDDLDGGATDPYGDGCGAYWQNLDWCGGFDDSDFSSDAMCCACGVGLGETGVSSASSSDTSAAVFGATGATLSVSSAAGYARLFYVAGGASLALRSLTITGGRGATGGAFSHALVVFAASAVTESKQSEAESVVRSLVVFGPAARTAGAAMRRWPSPDISPDDPPCR